MERHGRNAFFLMVAALFSWRVVGLIAVSILIGLGFGTTPVTLLMLPFVPYMILLPVLLIGGRKLLGRKGLGLLSHHLRPMHMAVPAVVYLLGLIASTLLDGGLIPDPVDTQERVVTFALAILLVPVATLSEEILFRALPKEMLEDIEVPGIVKASILVVSSAVLFTLPHLTNPEVIMTRDGRFAVLYYLLWGMMAMAIGLWDGGFESTFAIHTVNNLFVALVVNYENSALPIHAFFLKEGDVSTYSLIVTCTVLYALVAVALHILRNKEKNEQNR